MEKSGRSEFLAGMRRALPVVLSVGPFAVLFGALAVDNGLTPLEVVTMSAAIYAGASQMVGIQLFGGHVAAWLIVFSIFAVNFRHVLYSATVGRKFSGYSRFQKAVAFFFLVDPQFAEAEKRDEAGGRITFAWYMGVAVPVYSVWVALSLVGAYFGRLIENPEALGIDFLLPLYFLGLVMEFRHRANWLPVVVASAIASIVAYRLVGSPWHVTLGALAGILVAALMPISDGQPATIGEASETSR